MKWWQLKKRNADLERELQADLELEEEEQRANGLSPAEARAAARRAFGNPTLIREHTHEAWGWAPFERLWQDVHYALRQFGKHQGFSLTAVLTLALGIGATTAIFTVLDAVLLDPLPFSQPDLLVAIGIGPDRIASIPTMQDLQTRSSSFASMAAYRSWTPAITGLGNYSPRTVVISQNFFSTLGVGFSLGNAWLATGNEQDCTQQAVVSSAFWNHLGGGGSLGGHLLHIDGREFEIAGVLRADQPIEGSGEFNQPELFLQVGCDPDERPNSRGDNSFSLIGRLRDGVSLSQARTDLAHTLGTLQSDYPSYYAAAGSKLARPPQVTPYLELVVGSGTRPAMLATFAACGLILLIACTNLANLLLARNTRRRHEFATRATLGASLGRLLRQLLAENALLTVFGASAGIALAAGIVQFVKTSKHFSLPRLAHASMRPSVFVFTIAVAVAVSFLLTLLPAWRTLRPGLIGDLQGERQSTGGRSLRRIGRLLVMAQLTLALVLIACAGWMVGGVYILLHQPLGFSPDHLLGVHASIKSNKLNHEDALQAERMVTQLTSDLGHLPGVVSASVADRQALGHWINRYGFCSDAHPEECRLQVNPNPNSYAVAPGYFATLEQPLLAGRDFTDNDDGRNPVAIVNQALAAREWPGQSAVGHRIFTEEINGWANVVGVVENVHSYDLETAPGPDLYIPRSQDPGRDGIFLIRTAGDPVSLKPTVKTLLQTRYPALRLRYQRTVSEEMSAEVAQRSFLMQVALAFGAVALFLSILGTYGLLVYEVSLREKEIGIRLALGSSRERIVRLLLRQEGRWLLGGAVLGLACSIAAGYILRANFYGAGTASVPVLLISTALLLGSALLAIAIPARRASRQDPAGTLRSE